MSVRPAWIGRAAQRVAHQPPRARGITFQNRQDLAREAVGWMRVLGRRLRHTRFQSVRELDMCVARVIRQHVVLLARASESVQACFYLFHRHHLPNSDHLPCVRSDTHHPWQGVDHGSPDAA